MKSKEVADEYKRFSVELATMIGQLQVMHERCSYLSDVTHDNADPEYDLLEAIRALGVTLAAVVNYADAYAHDDPDKEAGSSDELDEDSADS